jgi:serine/threonine protein kinase/tetratricopeptide (TPR) repeat protein
MQEGDLIAGRFRLETRAGAGAMGVVFRARDDNQAGQVVALKTWQTDGIAQLNRFLREAAALANLEDPAIVRHIQHGVSEQGEPFLAMEWVDGPTLAQRLAGPGLSAIETLELGQRLLQGLAALHVHGIVHRDLKPSNIMLPRSDVRAAQILDLGIARFAQASTDLTAQGSHLGTPRYMAPEQIRDPRSVDGRADVFALGCVLFECLTGVPAFPGDDPVAVLAQILFGQVPEPSELRAELPEELDVLLASLLSRRLELRPSVNTELRSAFSRLLAPPHRQALALLPPMPAMPPRAAQLMTVEAAETDLEACGLRPSAPRLLDRASRPAQSLFPAALQPLIGRERELAELSGFVQAALPITLWGGAGVGKTRLAHELVRQLVQQGSLAEHAVVLCDLSEARDTRDLVRITAQAVGVAPPARENAEDLLGRMLAKLGPLLIVLDRAEHLAREIEPLVQLWTRLAPALRLLVTSRVLLRSTRAYELGPLASRRRPSLPPGPQSTAPEALNPQPSAAAAYVLWLAQSGGALPSASLTLGLGSEPGVPRANPAPPSAADPKTLDQAERIASLLEGNPLAIELALAQLPLLGLSGILERLPSQSGTSERLSERPLPAAMRGTIEWSWQLLDEPERWAFMQCGVFHGPFTLRAAERVLILPQASLGVLEVLDSLREQSLLVSRSSAGQPSDVRISMPAVLREFAHEQLELAAAREPSLAAARARHAAYCAELAAAGAGEAQLGSEDWMAAAEYALSPGGRNISQALTLLLALERTLLAAGPASRLAAQLEQALSALPDPLPDALLPQAARARQLRARLSTPAGELAQAERDLEAVREQAERMQDRQLLGSVLLDLGVVQHFRRALPAARACYEAALDMLVDVDDAVAEARCHGNLGAVFHDQAALSEAARGYRRAIALLPAHGQERLLANFQGNLALVEHERGRIVEARQLYEQAAALLESLLDARLLGIVLGNFGTLELAQGHLERALACLVRAQALLEQSGDRRSEGLSLARLSAGLALAGNLPEAEQRAARALRLLRRDSFARAVAGLLVSFVDLASAERAARDGLAGDAREAIERVSVAHDHARHALYEGRSLYEQSDDLRMYLAILEPHLARVRSSLTAGADNSAG